MKELSLFTGMGGGIYGSLILGWETVAYVERDEYCQKVIKQRIADGWFDKGEIYGDIKEFNQKHAHQYAGGIDILTGGFPCQPFSVAGKRKGTSDERYLFDEIIKTIKIIQPRQMLFENVPSLLGSPAIVEIYESLTKLGYIVNPPLVLGSDDCGNIHRRKRVWIFANAKCSGRPEILRGKTTSSKESFSENETETHCPHIGVQPANTNSKRGQRQWTQTLQRQPVLQRSKDIRSFEDLLQRPDIPEPLLCRMDDELSPWKQRLKAIGNGQDPIVMATAFLLLSEMNN